ncbi:MaoC like domai [Burkholderia cepacia]|nr:MaoC like domai [Burkholderia cepacia]
MHMLYFDDVQIGLPMVSRSHALNQNDMIAFARQWDPLPIHVDPVAACDTPVNGLIASGSHLAAIYALLSNDGLDPPMAGVASLRHELEILTPGRPGDVLTLTVTCLEKRPSGSKPDRGLVTMLSELNNQNGATVMRIRSLNMLYRRPGSAS